MKDFYCDSILNGKIKVSVVEETETVLAFYHTNPSWEIHIVIIPKSHIDTFASTDNMNILSDILAVAKKIVNQDKKIQEGYKLIVNGGQYQSSPNHLHWHLVAGNPQNEDNYFQKIEMKV